MAKDKCPITWEEMQELVKLLAKFIATNKGVILQKTDQAAHTLLGKWHTFQRYFKNRIEHFLPRIGNHPEVTLHGVITEWDPTAKSHDGEDVDIPVDFPPNIVAMYKAMNEEYVPSTPVKTDEAKLIRKILALDVRFLLGCGLEWDKTVTEDPSASGGAAQEAPPDDADRSRSHSLAPDPLKFSAWNVINLDQIPFDKILFSPDISLTSNRAYHAAAILFFLAPELPLKFPQVKDALHAGWMAVFSLQAPHELRGIASASVRRRGRVRQRGTTMVCSYHTIPRRQLGSSRPFVARHPR